MYRFHITILFFSFFLINCYKEKTYQEKIFSFEKIEIKNNIHKDGVVVYPYIGCETCLQSSIELIMSIAVKCDKKIQFICSKQVNDFIVRTNREISLLDIQVFSEKKLNQEGYFINGPTVYFSDRQYSFDINSYQKVLSHLDCH